MKFCDNGVPTACDLATVYITIQGVGSGCNIIFAGDPESPHKGYGFSPNGDGVNDFFVIEGLEFCYPDYQIEIYNRYGNVVFDYAHSGDSNSSPTLWDGRSTGRMTINKDEVLPVGTYFYIIYFNNDISTPNNPNDDRKPKQGYVYLTK